MLGNLGVLGGSSHLVYWLAWELGSKYIGNWKIRVNLVGGFTNPFEKYAARQIGSSTQVKGENSKKSLSCHHLAMVNKGLIRPYFWGGVR